MSTLNNIRPASSHSINSVILPKEEIIDINVLSHYASTNIELCLQAWKVSSCFQPSTRDIRATSGSS